MTFVSEFQNIRNGEYFGRAEHVSREAAEAYAVANLMSFGEAESDARSAASIANETLADASAHGFAVRIFETDC